MKRLRALHPPIDIAINALTRNRLQTALTMLGIAVGVATVLAMMAVGAGAQRSIEQQVRAAGLNQITITAGNWKPKTEDSGAAVAHQGDAGDTLVLVLDGVQDPHNLGACLRTAEAAGVHAVIVPKDRAAGLTPVARKVAAGSAERVPVITVTNLARTLKRLADLGYWVTGLAGEAETSLFEADLTGPRVLVLGAEGEGLRRLTKEHCHQLVRIPMAGKAESLNVSVAAAVCLYEAVRQRRKS